MFIKSNEIRFAPNFLSKTWILCCKNILRATVNYHSHVRLNMTCSSPRRTFFLHALSFQCTSKLCNTFINQLLVYFHIYKMHNTVQSLNCVVPYLFFKYSLQLFINFTPSFVAIELLTFCKNAKNYFIASRKLSLFWPNK